MTDCTCGDCGSEDADNFYECCGMWLCDWCADKHENKYPFPVKDFDVPDATITKEQARNAVKTVRARKEK